MDEYAETIKLIKADSGALRIDGVDYITFVAI